MKLQWEMFWILNVKIIKEGIDNIFVVLFIGYGLRCHRALKTICELIGIKDLHCKVEGNTKNVKAITNAFFDALSNQV